MAIKLEMKNSAQVTVDKIKNAVLAYNGEFNGDEKSGSIKINTPLGEVAGNYIIDGNHITVHIIKKPVFITEARIKNELAKYL